jgi:hypothetical protein
MLNGDSCIKPLGVNSNRRQLFNVLGITLIYSTTDSLQGISKSASPTIQDISMLKLYRVYLFTMLGYIEWG